MSGGWSWFVIVLVASNIIGCGLLLWYTARRRPGQPAAEETGHVWDGITEYNKPLPRWWINLFYLTIVFSIGYLFWYGGWGDYEGTSGWTSRGEHAAASAESEEKLSALFAGFEGKPLQALVQDEDALRLGRSIFANNCATCHGSDARGAKGFPDLSNAHWQWGGEPEQVLQTILHGRQAAMPALGTAIGGEQGTTEVAVYVQQLAGRKVDERLASRGKARFDMVCAACHGVQGTGNPALGAPDLTDGEWLYGSDFDSIRATIANGRTGQMPAHVDIIGEARARLVAAWVLSLSLPEEELVAAATAAAQGTGAQ
jgi:cytochrome c oxidase cbb3-type subunit 3